MRFEFGVGLGLVLEFGLNSDCYFSPPLPAAEQLQEEMEFEDLDLELIDYGAEEVSADEDALVITGTFESFGQLQTKLEADGMEIVESGLERVPNITKELDLEATAEVEKLIERLEEDDDVQNVFHTMSSSTEAEA